MGCASSSDSSQESPGRIQISIQVQFSGSRGVTHRSILLITSAAHFGDATVVAAKISMVTQPMQTGRSRYARKPTEGSRFSSGLGSVSVSGPGSGCEEGL